MRIAGLMLAALALSSCSWHYGTRAVLFNGYRYDVLCPDPPPLHPDVIIGSTPCIFVPIVRKEPAQ